MRTSGCAIEICLHSVTVKSKEESIVHMKDVKATFLTVLVLRTTCYLSWERSFTEWLIWQFDTAMMGGDSGNIYGGKKHERK